MDVTPGKQALGANTSEGVLANFFNSLLSKKTGAGGVSPAGPGLPPGARPGASPQPDDCKYFNYNANINKEHRSSVF